MKKEGHQRYKVDMDRVWNSLGTFLRVNYIPWKLPCLQIKSYIITIIC